MKNQAKYSIGAAVCAAGLLTLFWGCEAPPSQKPQLTRGPATTPKPVVQRSLPTPNRSLWVARYHYRAPDDIQQIMRETAEMGFDTVIWQVRGEGTVAYPSQLEPWSKEYKHQHPGYDPLAVAVEEAHRNGLRIEAWINVMPGWRGPNPPATRAQHWYSHPDWFLHDSQGNRQELDKFYVILNPCLPEVQQHIIGVAAEICRNYAVDGIHLDYVRYAWDTTPNGAKLYPRDPRTLALYQRDTGLAPDDDPAKWNAWRANQITRIVEGIRNAIDRERPGGTLTAAIWRNPKLGYDGYLQNSAAWLRAGLLDSGMPMVYTDDVGRFRSDIMMYKNAAPNARISPGIGAYKFKVPAPGAPEPLREELAMCQSWGGDFTIFSLESLAPTVSEIDRSRRSRTPMEAKPTRDYLRSVLADYLRRDAGLQ